MRLLAMVAVLSLAACGLETGPPATGATSSAPNAVAQAEGGTTGGGANVFNSPRYSHSFH